MHDDQHWQEQRARALAGEAQPQERRRLEAHLGKCADCARRWQAELEVERLLLEMALQEPAFLDNELARLHARLDAEPARFSTARRLALVGGALAAGLAAWWFVRSGTVQEPPMSELEVAEYEADVSAPSELEVERAREQVAAALQQCFLELSPTAPSESWRGAMPCFERATADLAHDGWPITRLVEGQLASSDLACASAAARFVGLAGDRLSAALLGRQLARPELRGTALVALGDLGPAGQSVLIGVLERPELFAEATQQLARDPERASVALERALSSGSLLQAQAFCQALAWCEDEGTRALLRIGQSNEHLQAAVLEALQRSPAAPAVVAQELERALQDARSRLPFLCQASGWVAAEQTAPSLVEAARWRNAREPAIAALAQLHGKAPWQALLVLELEGIGTAQEREPLLQSLLQRDPASLLELLQQGEWQAEARRALARMLQESANPAAALPLAALARGLWLERDERVLALLTAAELSEAQPTGQHELLVEELQLRVGERGFEDERVLAAAALALARCSDASAASAALTSVRLTLSPRALELLESGANRHTTSTLLGLARELAPTLARTEASSTRNSP